MRRFYTRDGNWCGQWKSRSPSGNNLRDLHQHLHPASASADMHEHGPGSFGLAQRQDETAYSIHLRMQTPSFVQPRCALATR